MRLINAILISLLISCSICAAQATCTLERDEAATQTEKRIALVIGIGGYQNAKALPNPANDAAEMAKALKEVGFEVFSGTNLTKRQMESLIRDFGSCP